MALGTIFTLFVVPSVYVLVAKDHSKERERLRVPTAPSTGEPLLAPGLSPP
jgi:multidrug efflux pump